MINKYPRPLQLELKEFVQGQKLISLETVVVRTMGQCWIEIRSDWQAGRQAASLTPAVWCNTWHRQLAQLGVDRFYWMDGDADGDGDYAILSLIDVT